MGTTHLKGGLKCGMMIPGEQFVMTIGHLSKPTWFVAN